MFHRDPSWPRNCMSAPGRSGNSTATRTSSWTSCVRPPTMWRTRAFARSFSVRSSNGEPRATRPRGGEPVVELGDAAVADHLAEGQERPGLLRDGHREDRLAVLADLGPLDHLAEAREVHVRPRPAGPGS